MTTKPCDPVDHEAYMLKFNENYKIEGFGLNVQVSYPCPACSSPDYLVAPILGTEAEMKKNHICGVCERSFTCIFHVNTPEETRFEIVQTGGDNMPDYLPQMRRVDNDNEEG